MKMKRVSIAYLDLFSKLFNLSSRKWQGSELSVCALPVELMAHAEPQPRLKTAFFQPDHCWLHSSESLGHK